MKNQIREKYLISPFYVYFLTYIHMIGPEILSFQGELIKHAGYNAWISVLIMAISIHLILWMMYKISSSNQEGQDVTAINKTCFGNVLGNILNLAIVLYFFLGAFIVFRTYIEVIQVWIFPNMNIFPLSVIIALLIYYTVSGGLRTITGISFWGFIISYIIVIPLIFIIISKDMHPQNLLPLLDHSVTDILLSTKSMVYQYMGFEALLIIYPFIKTPAKSQKWAQLGVLTVTFIHMVNLILAFMYYSEGQLRHINWPTLTMIMSVEVPLLQRLEYFVISVWFVKMVANICIGLWAACRGMKNTLHIKQRLSLLVFLAGFLILELFINDRGRIQQITEFYSNVGFYFIYVYILTLFLITLVRRKLVHNKRVMIGK